MRISDGSSDVCSSDLLAAAAERGLPVIDDANAESNEGAVYADYNAVVGDDGAFERWSTARAYLEPALGRADLDVLVGSRVHGLIVEGSVVRGIRHVVDGRMQSTSAARTVLAAGALDTPRLLQLSGDRKSVG